MSELNFNPVAKVLRARAGKMLNLDDESDEDPSQEAKDNAELILVLARLLEGKSPYQAFGSPGDWGYGTEIGYALAKVYRGETS